MFIVIPDKVTAGSDIKPETLTVLRDGSLKISPIASGPNRKVSPHLRDACISSVPSLPGHLRS